MLRVKKIKENAKLPSKAKIGDAGYDCFSCENKKLVPKEWHKFNLGIAVEFPENYVLYVCEKSGMAVNNGIMTIGNVIDSNYRGEINAILVNLSNENVQVEIGQKIAQLLLLRCYTGQDIIEVEELTQTERGVKGFGSTGKF